MSGNVKPTENNSLLVVGLGIIAALLIFTVLTNKTFPLISNERTAMVVLVVIGVAMCALGGIGPTIAKFGWTSPIFIIGAVLGILMLLIPGAVLAGVKLPLIAGEHDAIIALAILGIVKIIVNFGYGLLVSRGG